MRLFPIGGWLLVVGCLLLVVTAVMATAGASISVGGLSPGGIVAALGLAAIAAGAALIGIGGQAPLDSSLVRTGLVALAVGIALVVATAGATLSNPLVIGTFAGGVMILAGAIVTALGLARAPGRGKSIVLTFLAGLALNMVSGAIFSSMVESGTATSGNLFTTGLSVAGGGLMLAAIAGVGLLAIGPIRRVRPGGSPATDR